jgi:hypothetical protein
MPDFIETFAEALTDTALSATADFLGDQAKDELTRAGVLAIFVSASAEITKASVEHLLGPLLKAFLKIVDPTQRKLGEIEKDLAALLDEPLQRGIGLARAALAVKVITEGDRRLRQENLFAAVNVLEQAYYFANRSKWKGHERIQIRLTQALIAKSMDAPGHVEMYLKEFASTLTERIALARKEAAEALHRLREAEFNRTAEGQSRLLESRREMLLALGPSPIRLGGPSGTQSIGISPGAREFGVLDDRTWSHARKGILKSTEPASQGEIKAFQLDVARAEERLNQLLAFQKFWVLPD